MPASAMPQDRTDQRHPAQPHDSGSDSDLSGRSHSESLQRALSGDDNVLVPMRYPALKEAFLTSLEAKKDVIEATVRFHLRARNCYLSAREVWKSGSFNVAIPVHISRGRTVLMRIPFPHRIGEDQCPGNLEEKLRTEIATYIWLRQNCPDIPIPELLAFGLPDGSTFSHPLHAPFWEKSWWTLKRFGFLLISEARGKKLAWSWLDHFDDKAYRERLFRGLSRIFLSLNSVPLPRIGSYRLQPDASLALCNRPLSFYFHMLENEGIPTRVPRNRTYAQVESYLSDLLSFHDNKIRHQPNAIHDQDDGMAQLAALTTLRATMHHFIRQECRDGPFFLQLTDLHQQNIFVDQDWNIQTIIDLEWAHTLPSEMHLPPYWLSSRNAVDSFDDEAAIAEYEAILEEYWAAYQDEERKRNGTVIQVPLQRDVWSRGSFWYFHAIRVPKGMYTLFNRHIQPLFNKEHAEKKIFDEVFYWYWGFDVQDLIDKKLRDKQEYVASVREALRQGREKKQ
ncbi:Protein kinase-like domain protein [Metarhizium album ARSEF 1941]|uniref:Protein kinase-like domain protein n=1 Tax=Metarhizium album (strain ARSEF 1941) TaxID=1081103 RepID=A0A0B2WYJ6_METAS|nr:Protein kinase-like domain protein [Metarhizium album ARSEF 1941]KHN98654.1 Protein kinase-like domain protein [Metarhizium album ARSEF 1941]